VRLNEHLEHEDGAIVFRHACKMGLEGIVSKRRDSPYRSGREISCAVHLRSRVIGPARPMPPRDQTYPFVHLNPPYIHN
jgi:hypothetical protein